MALIMAAEMIVLLGVQRFAEPIDSPDPALVAHPGNLAWIGEAMFTRHVLAFEVAAVILTVAIIAAITLTLRRRAGTKHQDPARQVRVRASDRLRMIKMDPVVKTKEETP